MEKLSAEFTRYHSYINIYMHIYIYLAILLRVACFETPNSLIMCELFGFFEYTVETLVNY